MELLHKNKPLICLPLTAKDEEELIAQYSVIASKNPDMIELRADFLTEITQTEKVLDLITLLGDKTTIPLLFTIRSEREGGQVIPLDDEGVVLLLCEVAKHSKVQYIDYEVSNQEENIKKVVTTCHAHGKKVVMSHHNFTETPENEVLLEYFAKMEGHLADIAKIAVMPNNKADVLRLLTLTAEADKRLDIPIVTMSMGELGKISRLLGWVYGSVITFGIGAESSAPGQIPIEELSKAIDSVQSICREW